MSKGYRACRLTGPFGKFGLCMCYDFPDRDCRKESNEGCEHLRMPPSILYDIIAAMNIWEMVAGGYRSYGDMIPGFHLGRLDEMEVVIKSGFMAEGTRPWAPHTKLRVYVDPGLTDVMFWAEQNSYGDDPPELEKRIHMICREIERSWKGAGLKLMREHPMMLETWRREWSGRIHE